MTSDWIKLAPMNALQSRVAQLGICPFCHTKTLHERFNDGNYRSDQCAKCGKAFIDQARRLVG